MSGRRLDADHLRWKLHFFFRLFLRISERDDFHDIHNIRASASSHAFRTSLVITGRIEASATGNEAIPDVTTYVAA